MEVSKIIYGRVGPRGTYTEGMITEEDYGIVFQMSDLDLPTAYQVDFSNKLTHGTSITMLGDENGVSIPTELIDTGKDVYAFLYWTGADFGRTIKTWRIVNKRRPKRTDATPTPEQQSVIDQTIAALNDAVESTAADAEQTASDAARAEAARDRAETAEDNAEASATAAAQSETNASTSASTASAAATSASASAASAYADAERAEQAAAQSGYLWFYIEDGKLYMDRTQNTHVNFFMRDGKLYVEEVS